VRFSAIYAIFMKGAKEVLREPEVIFWIIVFPMMYLCISTIWVKPPSAITLNLGVVYADETINNYRLNATTIVEILNETVMDDTKIFNIRVYGSEVEGIEAVRAGKIDLCIIFPNRFSMNLTWGFPAKLKVYIGTGNMQRAQFAEGFIRGILSRFSEKLALTRAEIPVKYLEKYPINFTAPVNVTVLVEAIKLWILGLAQPLNVTYTKVTPKIGRWSWEEGMGWMTLAMIGVMFLFAGMLSAAVAIAEERERGTLRRLLAAPISPWDVLLGYTLAILFEQALSIAATVLFGTIALHAKIIWNPIEKPVHILIPVIFLLMGLFSIGLGLIISMFCRTTKAAVAICQAISWPLMFITGITIPKFMLPSPLRSLADVFPISLAIESVRRVVVYGEGWSAIVPVIPYLIVVSFTVYFIGAIAYSRIVAKVML